MLPFCNAGLERGLNVMAGGSLSAARGSKSKQKILLFPMHITNQPELNTHTTI